jgi:capsular exopolysaccharide synthesis family protein
MENEELELKDYLEIIKKRKFLIAFGVWICVISALIATLVMTPIYEASIKLLVTQRQLVMPGSAPSAGESYQSVLVSERLAKTYSEMIEGRTTAKTVIKELGLKLKSTELMKKISAEPVRDTQLIKVKVRDTSALRAQRIANTIGKVFSERIDELEGAEGTVPLIKVSIAEPAIKPVVPIRPKPLLNVTLALIVGLMIGIGFAFLLEYLDISVKTAEEAERLLGLPVLGQIPLIKANEIDGLITETAPKSIWAEAYRTLRTNVNYLNFDQSLKIIGITSAGIQEGKSTVSLNLAAMIAHAGNKSLLICADLRRPISYSFTGQNDHKGLSAVLAGSIPLEEAIQKTPIKDFELISPGPAPPNPAELLASNQMKEILEKIKEKTDFAIIDLPPVLAVTDAAILAPYIDGFLLLVRAGITNRQAVVEAKSSLEKVGGKVVGVILNGVKIESKYYSTYRLL